MTDNVLPFIATVARSSGSELSVVTFTVTMVSRNSREPEPEENAGPIMKRETDETRNRVLEITGQEIELL